MSTIIIHNTKHTVFIQSSIRCAEFNYRKKKITYNETVRQHKSMYIVPTTPVFLPTGRRLGVGSEIPAVVLLSTTTERVCVCTT